MTVAESSPSDAYPNLLSPIRMGPLTFRNRVVIPGHSMNLGTEDKKVGDRYIGYLRERARGGAAVVGMGSAPIHPSSVMGIMSPQLWEEDCVDGLAKAAEAVHAEGSRLSLILWHCGHNVSHFDGVVPLAPSPVPSFVTGDIPKEMTKDDLAEIRQAYRMAARRCARAGLDVIEVQTASDYLMGAFLSPRLNRRTDEYGGSLENRCRFLVEVLEAVREEADSDTAVTVRTSAEHLLEHDPDGYGLDESVPSMKLLADKGLVDYVSVMTATNWTFEKMISPMHWARADVAPAAAKFKRELSVPVVVAGRIKSPEEAEEVIAKGQADCVAMARAHIAEPDWTAKLERGERRRIRPCMSCNQACLGFAFRAVPSSCIINPRAGREYELPDAKPAGEPKDIAVVGGGPAGMEAARVAAARGHRVSLYEAEPRLGGAFRLAAEAPHRGEMRPALAWWEGELERLNVDVHLSARVSDPAALGADKVVWATGARPANTHVWRNRPQLFDGIPGTETLPHGRDILAGRRGVSGKVLVIDEESGWASVSTVESINAMPDVSSVTVTTDRMSLGLPDLQFTVEIEAVAKRMSDAGVTIHTSTLVDRVENGMARTIDGRDLGPFDAIVLATGAAVTEVPDGVEAIGDCVTPRSIWAAVTEGLELGRRL